METNNKTVQKEGNFFSKITDRIAGKDKYEFNAEYAWYESTYGRGPYKPVEERIASKQKRIKERIEECFKSRVSENAALASSYYCFIIIEEDLYPYNEQIFQPFVDNGFEVKTIDQITDDHVYLISWKHVYKDNKKIKANK